MSFGAAFVVWSYFLFNIYLLIWLRLRLSCSMQDLLVAACELLVAACGI